MIKRGSNVKIVLVPGECNEDGNVSSHFTNFEFENAKVEYDDNWIIIQDAVSLEIVFMSPRESVYFVWCKQGG